MTVSAGGERTSGENAVVNECPTIHIPHYLEHSSRSLRCYTLPALARILMEMSRPMISARTMRLIRVDSA